MKVEMILAFIVVMVTLSLSNAANSNEDPDRKIFGGGLFPGNGFLNNPFQPAQQFWPVNHFNRFPSRFGNQRLNRFGQNRWAGQNNFFNPGSWGGNQRSANPYQIAGPSNNYIW
ncbi:hypothetical protein SNE40_009168 [Patella caerulea]|uniref:Uncharacterized protein n=1 Tax=Patella caerulea TaxID=87958 RepID=A0AAN8JTI6_PATCE